MIVEELTSIPLTSSQQSPAAPLVSALAYLVIEGADIPAWEEFACGLLGLEKSQSSDRGRLVLRIDDRRWRLDVREDGPARTVIGFDVTSEVGLERVADALQAAGVPAETGREAACRDRGVKALVQGQDPAGNALEFVYGPDVTAEPFVSPSGAQFVTGDQGMGHVVLLVEDFDAVMEFYTRTLSFSLTDRMRLGPAPLGFLHCNARHHTVAVMGIGRNAGLHHFMVQVDDLDIVGAAYDRCLDGAAPIEMTLGRGSNDEMLSFYAYSPSGFSVELGFGGVRLDQPRATPLGAFFDRPARWGHRHLGDSEQDHP